MFPSLRRSSWLACLAFVCSAVLCLPRVALAQTLDFAAAVEAGPLQAALVALLGGLGVSLTPCVYPMIAITVSAFGGREGRSRMHAIGLSSAFMFGIVCMFTPLGVAAGLTGLIFGSVLQNVWVLTGIAVLFLVMSTSLFGAFDLALPSSLTNWLARVGGAGARGAFGLGLTCGLIAAPCSGPVLTTMLTWIAQKQSVELGALAMAVFALGLGFPFFLVGAFAVQLPKSGRWMVHIKSVLAIIMAVVALYYLNIAFPQLGAWVRPGPLTFTVASALAVLGLLAGALHRDFAAPGLRDKVLKSLGASTTTLALFVLVIALSTAERTLTWSKASFATNEARALREKKPLLVDFTAGWCGACKELEKHTFAEQKVNREAGRFVAVRVDATNDEDPTVKGIMSRLRVVGLPTVLLIDSEGREAARFTSFVEADEFLATLRRVH